MLLSGNPAERAGDPPVLSSMESETGGLLAVLTPPLGTLSWRSAREINRREKSISSVFSPL